MVVPTWKSKITSKEVQQCLCSYMVVIGIGMVGGRAWEKLNLRARMRVWTTSLMCVMCDEFFFVQDRLLSERNICAICMWPLHIAKRQGVFRYLIQSRIKCRNRNKCVNISVRIPSSMLKKHHTTHNASTNTRKQQTRMQYTRSNSDISIWLSGVDLVS